MSKTQTSLNQTQTKNCILWGCGIALVFFCLVSACLAIGFGLALVGVDLRGTNLEDGINIIPWGEFLEDPANIQDLPEILFGGNDPDYDEADTDPDVDSYQPAPTREFTYELESIPGFVPYSAEDFDAEFLYPEDWEIEVEEYRITFYDPDSNTYLYMGVDEVDEGITAAQVADEVIETLKVEAEEDSFVIFENEPYYLPAGYDSYLNVFEWTDDEGFYHWAYDLEIIRENTNVFFFLVGDEAGELESYRSLIETVVDSFVR